MNTSNIGTSNEWRDGSQQVKHISINMPKMLKFLDNIENLKCRFAILKLLSERLHEDGVVSCKYDSLNRLLPKTVFKGVNGPKNAPGQTSFEDILGCLSQDKLVKPSIVEAQEAQGSFLIFPTFGPYARDGIFILHSSAMPSNHMNNDIHALNMVLQKTHNLISIIEAEQEQDNLALTPRQIDVLAGISSGLNNQEVADLIGISIHTVNGYLRTIMLKLGTHDRLNTALAGLSIPQIISRVRKVTPKPSNFM